MKPAERFEEKPGRTARLEPFDSFWQSPEDIEKGYGSFEKYYRANYVPLLPSDKSAKIVVLSCGPGYLVNTLIKNGYQNVTGADSDPTKVEFATDRDLPCRVSGAFEFLQASSETYDVIIPEQELNHLTLDETVEFLNLCRSRLNNNGMLIVYGLNGANPLVGAENLAQNIDHFSTFTEHSLFQILTLSGFTDIQTFPLKIYVFWKNPLNYVGLAITGLFEFTCRIMFKLYGKNVSILSKKIAAIARKT